MIGIGVTTRNNSAAIARQIAKRKSKILRDFAEDVISIAGQSMKTVPLDYKSSSPPGSPPFVRSGKPNLRSMRYRIQGDSVTISPVRTSGNAGTSVPDILERGGMMVQRRKTRGGGLKTVRFYVKARPYVRPAAAKAMERLQGNIKRKGLA